MALKVFKSELIFDQFVVHRSPPPFFKHQMMGKYSGRIVFILTIKSQPWKMNSKVH